MKTPYEELIKSNSFKQLKQHHPHLQRWVYQALLDLSPGKLEFLLETVPAERTFNGETIDRETYELIGYVLKELREADNIVLTNDDIYLAYMCFCQLIFLQVALKQELIKPDLSNGEITYFFDFEDEEPAPEEEQTSVLRARPLRPFPNTGIIDR